MMCPLLEELLSSASTSEMAWSMESAEASFRFFDLPFDVATFVNVDPLVSDDGLSVSIKPEHNAGETTSSISIFTVLDISCSSVKVGEAGARGI